jgi:hypothetical protein
MTKEQLHFEEQEHLRAKELTQKPITHLTEEELEFLKYMNIL